MTWRWQFMASDGSRAPNVDDGSGRPEAGFASQSDAESWLGEHWRELVDAGVDSVVLQHDGQAVYGPMDLSPAE